MFPKRWNLKFRTSEQKWPKLTNRLRIRENLVIFVLSKQFPAFYEEDESFICVTGNYSIPAKE